MGFHFNLVIEILSVIHVKHLFIIQTMVKFHQRFADKNTSAMHYITFGSTLMTDVSGISVIKCDWTTSTTEWHRLVEICKPQLARRYFLQLIYGCAGWMIKLKSK